MQEDAVMDIAAIRADFPILQRVVHGKPLLYLDNAATTQRPRQVLETLNAFYAGYNANVHRSPHLLGQEATEMYEQAHENVARFIGTEDEGEIIFLRNTTEAINLVGTSLLRRESGPLQLQPGDEIVVTVMEHHSNLVPWQALCAEAGLALRAAGLLEDGSLDMEDLGRLLGPHTRLVCCTHVSNVLGAINPVTEIARMAHAAGALLLVDGAQAVPHMPVRVPELGCDFLAFSGHKMLAPFGIGVLYGRRELLEQMAPFLYGGDMIADVTLQRSTWNCLPWKFEAGTANIADAIALGGALDVRSGRQLVGAVDYLEGLGMERVHAYEQQLTARLVQGLSAIAGVRVYGPRKAERRGAAVSFTVEGANPHLVAQLLDDEGIAVRAGGHCAYPLAQRLGVAGTVRASPYIYNTVEEVDRFLAVTEAIVRRLP
jgi:cysteine desulfurase/selenocysteine lyase